MAGRKLIRVVVSTLAFSGPVAAGEYDGWGTGPVIAYAVGQGVSLGWELAGSRDYIWLRGSVGGYYRLGSAQAPLGAYVAFEPWLFVGGTLGASVSGAGVQPLYGLWEGVPLGFKAERERPQTVISIAVGWRGVGARQELYLTPKLWSYQKDW